MKYHPDTCPKCGHYLTFGALEIEADAVLQVWYCNGCNGCDAEGHDIYEATNRIVTYHGGGLPPEEIPAQESEQ